MVLTFSPGECQASRQFGPGERCGEKVRKCTAANVSEKPQRARQSLRFDTATIAEREERF